jgi:inner membrane protein
MIVSLITSLGFWFWVVLGLVLIGAELLSPGMFLLWLGLAALVTGLLDAGFHLSWQSASLVFVIASGLAVGLGRLLSPPRDPPIQPSIQGGANVLNQRGHNLIGRIFVLDTPLAHGEGRLRIDDTTWRITGEDLPTGTIIAIAAIEGATLQVRKADSRSA